jgi:transcriptional regulator with XRE-family HTH domain
LFCSITTHPEKFVCVRKPIRETKKSMTTKSRPPIGKRPAQKVALADAPLNGGSDVSRVAGETDVVGLGEATGALPLENGGPADIAGAGNYSPGGNVNSLLEGVSVGHVPQDSTVGNSLSITRSYEPTDDTHEMAPTYGSFWTRLLEAMADRGLPQTQVAAAKLGRVTQPAARKWAEGGLPDVDKIIDIAQRLDVSLDWLLTGEGPKRPPKYSEGDPHFEQMLDIWANIDADTRRRLVDFAAILPTKPKKS